MPRRLSRPVVSLTVALSLATALVPFRVRAAAPIPHFSLTAVLSVTPELSSIAPRVLMSEAERIWGHEGVRLEWPADGRAARTASAPLQVLVISRPEAQKQGANERWPVAELLPQTGSRAIAIASIAGAQRVLSEASPQPQLLANPQFREYQLGVVLGRAVAHEIGHYLLNTATHADRGLMRATIQAREFADASATTFTLDDTAGQWLRDRLRDTAPNNVAATAAGFSYTADVDPARRFK